MVGPRIPAEDLTRQYAAIQHEIQAALEAVLPSGRYTLGPAVQAFESEFAAYCQVAHAVGISSGTEALHLTLRALRVGPGDEVITACNTYAATAFAISYTGARPVFLDIDPITYAVDADLVAAAVTSRTKAIIPVHMYGQPADMDRIRVAAARTSMPVVEDAAHAHGATYRGRIAGSLGDAACFSFYPMKVLGCYGDGGAVTTADERLADALRVLRYMGQDVKHVHEVIGYQQRLDEIQAAILRVKLRHLGNWIAARRRVAAIYDARLSEMPVVPPRVAEGNSHVYYMYPIRVDRRDHLTAFLTARGIGTQVIYPTLVPFQPAYRDLGCRRGTFPVAEQYVGQILCLPMFPELRDDEAHAVCDAVEEFFRG